eukprot:1111142-Amphidinium_carterae.1
MDVRVEREWARTLLLNMRHRSCTPALGLKPKVAWTQAEWGIPQHKVWNIDEPSCYLPCSPNTGWYHRGRKSSLT